MLRLLFCAVVWVVCCCQSVPVVIAQQRHPRVCTEDGGCLQGISMTDVKNIRFDAFLGIPYAKPPVGSLRFKNPIPVVALTEEYNATESKAACLQRSLLESERPVVGNEDCLYLNVYRPKANASELPVMVYIHGGGYFSGSADPQLYGPERLLATQQALLVTIQYRLGVFGFLSTGDEVVPGNAGMHDQVLALKWVQRHIRSFGGDPGRVTIFGESAGGASVQLHLISPLSRGLFQRAVIMSGSALATWSLPIDDPLALVRRQAQLVGVSEANELTSSELVDVLQHIEGRVLTASATHLRTWFEHPIIIYRPVPESSVVPASERFLPEDPRKLWSEGSFADVPLMFGTVPNDGAIASLPMIYNATLLQEFNEGLVDLLPTVLAVNGTPEVMEQIKSRYFPDAPAGQWLTEQNSQQITQLFSDVLVKYPVVKSLLQYANKTGCRETTLYSFEFTGRHSFSSLYAHQANVSHGVVHQDELIYLFRMAGVFNDFPEGAPENVMADTWTQFFVAFASDSPPATTASACGEDNIKTETFANGSSNEAPIQLTTGVGVAPELQEMVKFWDRIYDSSYIAYH